MTLRTLFLAIGGLCLAACSDSPSVDIATESVTPIEKEALQQIQAEFQRYYTFCDGGWVTRNLSERARKTYNLINLRNIEIGLDATELSGADELNGIEYKGALRFGDRAAYRTFEEPGGWTEWDVLSSGDSFYGNRYSVSKTNGVWDLSDVLPRRSDGVFKIDCDEYVEPGVITVNINADHAMAPYFPWDPDAPNVKTTESGLQYIIVSEAEADGDSPSTRDRVSVMYEGRLADATMFDSSYERGSTSTFGVDQVISGWTEGLQLMSVGDEFVFYIPSELGYGQNPRPGGVIKPGDDLIFRVELKQVVKAPEPRATDDAAWDTYTPWNSDLPEIVKTGSGLEYVVLASGDPEGVSPQGNDRVVVYYEGRFDDGGEVFDSAFKRGEAAMFPANRVIPGWVEALQQMKSGDRWLVHVPGNLAYGPNGNGPIPPNAALNFEVELMDVVPVK